MIINNKNNNIITKNGTSSYTHTIQAILVVVANILSGYQ